MHFLYRFRSPLRNRILLQDFRPTHKTQLADLARPTRGLYRKPKGCHGKALRARCRRPFGKNCEVGAARLLQVLLASNRSNPGTPRMKSGPYNLPGV